MTRDTTFKVKGQGHQAALLTAVLARQAAATVGVGTCWPWETAAATLASAPTGEGERRGISWRPPADSLFATLYNLPILHYITLPAFGLILIEGTVGLGGGTCALLNAVLVVNPSELVADDCQLVAAAGRRQLRSSDALTCVIQRTRTRIGDRSFAVAGPRLWNILPC